METGLAGEDEAIEQRSREFPEDLDGRLNSVLNAVNLESKAITLLHLPQPDEKCIDQEEIKSRIRETTGPDCKLFSAEGFGAYCRHTLFPIGFVAREEITRDLGNSLEVGYGLTEAGKRYGLPVSSFALEYAVESGRSMFQVFGSTASTGNIRSPLAKAKMLLGLSTGDCSQADLKDFVHDYSQSTNASFSRAFHSLKKIGFLEFNEEDERQVNFSFSGKSGSPEPWRNLPGLTPRVLEYLKSNGTITATQVYRHLNHKHNSDSLNILNSLSSQGFATRDHTSNLTFGFQIMANLTNSGNDFVKRFLTPVYQAMTDERALQYLQERYDALRQDSSRFTKLVRRGNELYRQVSPKLHSLSVDENVRRISSYLIAHPGARPIDIADGLGLRPDTYLRNMLKMGKVKKEGTGRGVKYYLI